MLIPDYRDLFGVMPNEGTKKPEEGKR